MTNEKIRKLDEILAQNSSLVGSRQEHIIFTEFMLQKTRELQNVLKEYGISGKRDTLGLAILFLLEELSEDKTKTDGK